MSLPLLMQDFEALISKADGPKSKLKLEDFIARSIHPEAKQIRREFWTEYLKDVRPVKLIPPRRGGAQKKRVEIFQPALFSRIADLEQIARRKDISVSALLFAA